jgi:DNA-directed RNA polymerase specialized sigma24 family protein
MDVVGNASKRCFSEEAQAMRPMLLGVAKGVLDSDEEAEDVVQDALLRLWQLRDEPIRNVRGFARIVVRNLCLSKVRRKQVMVDISHADVAEEAETSNSLSMHPETLKLTGYEGDGKGFENVFDQRFNTDAYNQLLENDSLDLEEGYEQLLSFNTNYDLVMPGKVLDSGVGEYDSKVIHYRLSGDRTIPNGYKYSITATSRVTNVWAFVVTFLVIALAIGSFFLRRRT